MNIANTLGEGRWTPEQIDRLLITPGGARLIAERLKRTEHKLAMLSRPDSGGVTAAA